MVENTISLNIFSEPLNKRKGRNKPPDVSIPTETSNVSTTKTITSQSIQKPLTKNKSQQPSRMTVWKALKGKFVSNNDESPESDTSKEHSRGFIRKKPGADKKVNSNSNQEKYKTTRLFVGNPDIPEVPQRVVQAIKEPVFSSKGFKDLDIHPFMIKNIEENLGLSSLMAVQEKLIPVALSGKDSLVRSQTGSGKTLAFAVPIVQMLQAVRPQVSRSDGIYALVIVPSRELALQTHEVFCKLVKSFTWLVPGILMGGERRKAEKARLRKGITILTCTPGRLLDHITHTETLSLAKVKYFVLDEADRLLDLGYEKDVASIISALEKQAPRSTNHRQTFLLSATLSPGVERLAGLTLTKPARVDTCEDPLLGTVPLEVGDESQETMVLPDTLSQYYIVTPAKLRLVTLAAFILEKCMLDSGCKMIVFMATQDMVDFHTSLLSSGLEVFCEDGVQLELVKLHGNMAQTERTQVFNAFRRSRSGVLLCTDVASRGLDLPEVDWVVQYNGPASVSDYVHRVGRTARSGENGSAMLFLSTSEVGFITRLEAGRVRLRQQSMENLLKSLVPLTAGANSLQEAATRLQSVLEGLVEEESKMRDSACKAFTSWVRFYASYPRNLKECFSVKAIHLGHFAKSFALKEPPTTASQHAKSIQEPKKHARKRERDDKKDKRGQMMKKRPQYSEFDSGLEPIVKKKKKNK